MAASSKVCSLFLSLYVPDLVSTTAGETKTTSIAAFLGSKINNLIL